MNLREYPKWLYHAVEEPTLVQDPAEEAELTAQGYRCAVVHFGLSGSEPIVVCTDLASPTAVCKGVEASLAETEIPVNYPDNPTKRGGKRR